MTSHQHHHQQQQQSSPSNTSWDALRKQARQLEYELDARLVHFSRLASSSSPSNAIGGGGSSSKQETLAAQMEIDGILRDLTATVRAMEEQPSLNNPSITYLIQRHRSNLHDYSREFQRAKQNANAKWQHAELLFSATNPTGQPSSSVYGQQGTSESDAFLQERSRMENANSAADEILLQAMDSYDDLERQRGSIFGTQSRISSVLVRFPQLKALVGKISNKKNREAVILGSLVGVCGVTLLWYAIS